MQEYKVISAYVFKQGQSQAKQGPNVGQMVPWTIYKATLEGFNGEVSGFEAVNPGDAVTVESKQNGQYTNYNYKKVKQDGGQQPVQGQPAAQPAYVAPGAQPQTQPTGSSANERRILELLVLMAEQMAIPAEKIKEILERQ